MLSKQETLEYLQYLKANEGIPVTGLKLKHSIQFILMCARFYKLEV